MRGNSTTTPDSKLLSSRTRLRTLSPDNVLKRRATPKSLSRDLFANYSDALLESDLPYITPRGSSRLKKSTLPSVIVPPQAPDPPLTHSPPIASSDSKESSGTSAKSNASDPANSAAYKKRSLATKQSHHSTTDNFLADPQISRANSNISKAQISSPEMPDLFAAPNPSEKRRARPKGKVNWDTDNPSSSGREIQRKHSLPRQQLSSAAILDEPISQSSDGNQGDQNEVEDDDEQMEFPDTKNGLDGNLSMEIDYADDEFDADYVVSEEEGQATSDEPVNGAILTQDVYDDLVEEKEKDLGEANEDVEGRKPSGRTRPTNHSKDRSVVIPRRKRATQIRRPLKSSCSEELHVPQPKHANQGHRNHQMKHHSNVGVNKSRKARDNPDPAEYVDDYEQKPTEKPTRDIPALDTQREQDYHEAAQESTSKKESRDFRVEDQDRVSDEKLQLSRRRRGRPKKSEKPVSGTLLIKNKRTWVKEKSSKTERPGPDDGGSIPINTVTDEKQLENEDVDELTDNPASRTGRSAYKKSMRVSRRELPENVAEDKVDNDMDVGHINGSSDSNNEDEIAIKSKMINSTRRSRSKGAIQNDVEESTEDEAQSDGSMEMPSKISKAEIHQRAKATKARNNTRSRLKTIEEPTNNVQQPETDECDENIEKYMSGTADLAPITKPSLRIVNATAKAKSSSRSGKCDVEVEPSPPLAVKSSSKKVSSEAVPDTLTVNDDDLPIACSNLAKSKATKTANVRQFSHQRQKERKTKYTMPRTKPSKAAASNSAPASMISKKKKYKKRLSEVLKLQKALAGASWTDSKAVELQTEVIDLEKEYESSNGKNHQLALHGQLNGHAFGRWKNSNVESREAPNVFEDAPRTEKVDKSKLKHKTQPQLTKVGVKDAGYVSGEHGPEVKEGSQNRNVKAPTSRLTKPKRVQYYENKDDEGDELNDDIPGDGLVELVEDALPVNGADGLEGDTGIDEDKEFANGQTEDDEEEALSPQNGEFDEPEHKNVVNVQPRNAHVEHQTRRLSGKGNRKGRASLDQQAEQPVDETNYHAEISDEGVNDITVDKPIASGKRILKRRASTGQRAELLEETRYEDEVNCEDVCDIAVEKPIENNTPPKKRGRGRPSRKKEADTGVEPVADAERKMTGSKRRRRRSGMGVPSIGKTRKVAG